MANRLVKQFIAGILAGAVIGTVARAAEQDPRRDVAPADRIANPARDASSDRYREILERKYDTPLVRFEVIDFGPTTKALLFDWQDHWWGGFNVIETTAAGEPLYWYDIPDEPTAQSIERIRVVELSGRKFLEVIDCTHMGNGSLYLYTVERGIVSRELSARAIACGSPHRFDPPLARIEYRDTDGDGEDDVVIEADCVEEQDDGTWKPAGKYRREFTFGGRGYGFVERKQASQDPIRNPQKPDGK